MADTQVDKVMTVLIIVSNYYETMKGVAQSRYRNGDITYAQLEKETLHADIGSDVIKQLKQTLALVETRQHVR